jgi:hypothetical protein
MCRVTLPVRPDWCGHIGALWLRWLLAFIKSVLEAGCAAGGFTIILHLDWPCKACLLRSVGCSGHVL